MKSGKQRRKELDAIRAKKAAKVKKLAAEKQAAIKLEADVKARRGKVPVDRSALGRNKSYGVPGFVERGYYDNEPYTCQDCGAEDVWTGEQQKFWFEVVKGDLWTTASRCLECRKKERARREQAVRDRIEGKARKALRTQPSRPREDVE